MDEADKTEVGDQRSEVGSQIKDVSMDEKFLKAVYELLQDEGGYVNDPADPGGETKYGISKRSYPELDIKDLSLDVAVAIYFRDWWQKYGYGRIDNAELAGEVLELSVNAGPHRAHTLLQTAVHKSGGDWLNVDGELGELSFAAINRHPNQEYLTDKYRLLMIASYLKLNKSRYLAGWVKRAIV